MLSLGRPRTMNEDAHRQGQRKLDSSQGADFRSGRRFQIASMSGYRLMMSYISPLATACCTVATPSLRLAFSV